jgi:hypothetical protein
MSLSLHRLLARGSGDCEVTASGADRGSCVVARPVPLSIQTRALLRLQDFISTCCFTRALTSCLTSCLTLLTYHAIRIVLRFNCQLYSLPLTAEFELLKAVSGQDAVLLPEAKTPRCGFSEPDDGLAIMFAIVVPAAAPSICQLMRSRSAGYPYRPHRTFSGETDVHRSETPWIWSSGQEGPEKKLDIRKISSGTVVSFCIIMRRRLWNRCRQRWWMNTVYLVSSNGLESFSPSDRQPTPIDIDVRIGLSLDSPSTSAILLVESSLRNSYYRHYTANTEHLKHRRTNSTASMQADNASTIDSIRKEKSGNHGLDAEVRASSPTGVKDIEDAVFGAIGEDGPNYRNVSRLPR